MTETTTETEVLDKATRIRDYRLAHPEFTLKEIARRVECSSEYVRQVLRAANLPTKASTQPIEPREQSAAPSESERATELEDEPPAGHWSYAALVDGQATGWEGEYATRDEAREAAAAVYDEFVTGRLERKRYADLLPPMHALLNEVKEHAAEHGADTSSFESLDGHDYRLLQVLVEDTLKHWEAAVVERAPEKACSVRVVDHVQRHPAE